MSSMAAIDLFPRFRSHQQDPPLSISTFAALTTFDSFLSAGRFSWYRHRSSTRIPLSRLFTPLHGFVWVAAASCLITVFYIVACISPHRLHRRGGHTMGIEKRHYYVCAGETLSWQNNWYTQPWFTDYRQSYDRAASTGPVDPPLEIIQTVSACSRLLSSEDSRLSEVLASKTGIGGVVTTESVLGSRVSGGEVFPTTRTTIYTVFPTTTKMMSTIIPVPSGSSGSGSISGFSTATSITSSSTASATAQAAGIANNTCAGDLDWQGWGVIASLGIGLIVGGLIWLLWGILRGRLPGVYAARTWFVPPE